ncbi:hypothetical protein VFPBJ_05496 [Purpureocillium lilacinum]|uniref:Uncharacterized protein n=1 Tax=Purpureocillium lilacinum TaxID=33203 RepID=A0A179GRJ6_PURLI|nr:hypothetical protein VFPBJ_05496 [Purpureocillium lilacinum]
MPACPSAQRRLPRPRPQTPSRHESMCGETEACSELPSSKSVSDKVSGLNAVDFLPAGPSAASGGLPHAISFSCPYVRVSNPHVPVETVWTLSSYWTYFRPPPPQRARRARFYLSL